MKTICDVVICETFYDAYDAVNRTSEPIIENVC